MAYQITEGHGDMNIMDAEGGKRDRFHTCARLSCGIKVLGWISADMWKEYAEVLRRVRCANTLTILLPFEEEQAELKLFSEV
nr:hypothetical protein [Tanacetum cinerariifolium]